MNDIYICPECELEFQEYDAPFTLQNLNFNDQDDAIQAISLVHCPQCENLVVAIFDSMECSAHFDIDAE